ncbi:MAG: nucleotidyltransferase family protein [Candidatus Handelsmanbacteria bacterium]|nr:nucleotidyltransferase family protein [Candidatus Handelsmanbacteria bacterium]
MENRDPTAPTAIVLAAGQATRMGAFKQLLSLSSSTLIEQVVDQLLGHLQRVVVVVGFRGEEVVAVLGDRPVQWVCNPDFRAGMVTSVQCGIRNAGPAPAHLICLGDQPVLAGVLEPLLGAARLSPQGILIPTYGGKRGHPLYIRNTYTQQILALPPEQGLNTLTRAHAADTREVLVAEPGALEDLDTPADYERALKRYPRTEHG